MRSPKFTMVKTVLSTWTQEDESQLQYLRSYFSYLCEDSGYKPAIRQGWTREMQNEYIDTRYALLDQKKARKAVNVRVEITSNRHKVTAIQELNSLTLHENHLDYFRRTIRQVIRNKRYEIQSVKTEYRRIKHQEIELSGGVHTADGVILHIHNTWKMRLVDIDKTPQTEDRHVGIELEFICGESKSGIKKALVKAGLAEYVAYHEDGSVTAEDSDCDGSCRDNCECYDEAGEGDCGCECTCGRDQGHEICILAKESNYRSIVRRVTKVLSNLDASINHTCGFHVHLDMRTRNPRDAYRNLVNTLPVLKAMVPASRRENHYCKENTSTYMSDQAGRYHMINGESLDKHNTIEVRLHSGTTNPIKIINWITLLLRIVNGGAILAPVKSIRALSQHTKLSPNLKKYMKQRITLFGSDQYASEEDEESSTSIPLAA
jgi:hypothetical protein